MHKYRLRVCLVLLGTVFGILLGLPGLNQPDRALAQSTVLSINPLTWNVVGLDSNSPATGPHHFPIGAEVCNISSVTATNITVAFNWTSTNALIDLRGTTPSTINIPSLAAGACYDAYFEIEVTRSATAYNTARRYVITATAGAESVSTPVPREIFVEHLISQNRNATRDLRYGAVGADCNTLQSVTAGGSLNLVVGQSYRLCLFATTATQGYEQLETFLTLPNTIFQVTNVETDYSANTSGNVSTTDHPQLYADACYWENDPNSPNYRACNVSSLKAGGTILTAYDVRILSGGGSQHTLNSLIYDFSGSSFHYNSDYSSSARIANIIDPTSATIAKQFSPATISSGGVSTLVIILGNPNAGALSGYNFTDTLPDDMVVATPATYSTSGCGTPTFEPTAGSSTLTFSNGTVAGNGTCTISVKVTATTIQTYTNTTNNLLIGTVDTGKTATADLIVTSTPPPPPCTGGVALASWAFPSTSSTTAPAPSTSSVTASTSVGSGMTPSLQADRTGTTGSSSWAFDNISDDTTTLVTGLNEYFQFTLNTTGFTEVTLQFYTQRTTQGAKNLQIYYGATGTENTVTADTITTGWQPISHTLTTGINSGGNTVFRVYLYNAGVDNAGHYAQFDDVVFTGCGIPTAPSLTKAFTPNPIGAGGVSTLTFTLSNPNPLTALTGASFTDSLPTGMTVAGTPAASTTCAGATWAPTAGATTLTFSGGTIPAGSPGTCTAQVNVTSLTTGPSTNVSGNIATTQTGTNSGTNGSASASLLVLEAPEISKNFSPNPIVETGISTLTFSIVNPNPSNAIAGVAFTDNLLAGITVAAAPNAVSDCGGTLTATGGTGTISLAGGGIAAGDSCTIQVDVTGAAAGNYPNTTGNVSHTVNAATYTGNTASDTLVIEAGTPGITILKQVGTTNTLAGPWFNYVSVAAGTNVYYLFTIENTGDVPLTGVSVTDPTLTGAGVNLAGCTTATLPVADANDNDHIYQCIVGPLTTTTGSQANVASTSATPPTGPAVTDDSNTATYATAALTMVKAATPIIYTTSGTLINYTFTVTNSGSSTLDGPVTIADNLTTNEACPALTTIGDNDNFFDPGEVLVCTASYTTTPTDVTNGSIVNVASASADGFTSPTDTETVATAFADLELTKALTTTPTNVGDAIQYTLTLTNNGPDTATNVSVVDNVPASITVGTVTPGATSVNASATTWLAPTWTIPTIASGETVTLVINGTVNAGGTITNSAEVTASDQPDPDSAVNNDTPAEDDQDSAEVTVALQADLELDKALTTTPTNVGDAIQYTLTLTNNGPNTATNVAVTDNIPASITVGTVTPGVTSVNASATSWTAPTWTIPTIASGETVTLVIDGTVNTGGTITNSTEVTASDQADPDSTVNNNVDTEDDQDSAEVTVAQQADLELAKALTTPPTNVGDAIQYTLTLTNNGPNTATNVAVTDNIPASITVGTVTPGATSVNASATTWLAPTWTIPTVASGETVILVINGTVNTAGTIINGAEVTTSDQADPDSTVNNNVDTEDDQDSATIAVGTQADLELAKALTTTPTNVGDAIQYILTLTNNGPNTATNVEVTDNIPASITVGTVTPGTTNVNASATTWLAPTWTIPTIANGETVTLVIDGTVNTGGTITNSAEVTADDVPDPDSTVNNNVDTEDDQDSVEVTVALQADLELDKALTTTPTNVGDAIQYTLTLTNNGPNTATNILVVDNVPANVTVGTVTPGATSVNASATTWTAPTWTIPTIANGETVTLIINGTVNAGGTITNSAEVTASDLADPDSTVNNNTPAEDDQDSAVVTVAQQADLELAKALTTTPTNVGDAIQYTLTLTNNGPNTATNVAVTDNVPASVTVGTVTPGATSVNASATTWTAPTWTIPTIASGETVTLVINGTINAPGTITNSAEVTASDLADPDSTVNNNVDTEDDQDSAEVIIGVTPVIGIAKDVSAPVNNTNGTYTVTYTLNVENLGNIALQNVQVTDDLTTEFGTYEATVGAVDAAGEYTVTNINLGTLTAPATTFTGSLEQNLLAGTDTLPVGTTLYPIIFEVTFYPNLANAPFENQATASGETGTPDGTPETTDTSDFGTDPDPDGDGNPNEAGENDPTTITFAPTANLSAAKANDVGGGTTTTGTFTWTLTVTNDGTGDAVFADGDVILEDQLPPTGLTYGTIGVGNDVGITNLANINCAITTATLTCTATGASVTIGSATGSVDITIPVTADVAGLYANPTGTCAVDTGNLITELDETDNACNSDTVSVDQPNVAASKTDALTIDADSNALFDPGDTIGYTVVISNSGIVDANAVVFNDTPDANTTLLVGSVTTTQGTVTTGNTAGDTTISVDVGTVTASGGTVTITFSVTINDPLPATVTSVANSGVVTGANITTMQTNDPNTTPDDDPTTTDLNTPTVPPTATPQPSEPQPQPQPAPVITVFDPAISKVGILQEGGIGLQNEQIEWVFTVTNAGNGAGQDVRVTDSIRPELRIDRLNVDPPLTGAISGQNITVTIPSLSPGESVSFSVITTVISRGGEIDNTACLTAANFGNTLCSTGSVVTELPATGETPWWRQWLFGLLIVTGVGLAGLMSIRRIARR